MATKAAKLEDVPADEKASGKFAGKKKLIIAAAAVLLLGGGGAGYMMMKSNKAVEIEKAAAKKKTVFFDLPEVTVNLATPSASDRPVYLRMKIALEVEDQKMVGEIQPLMPRVIDNFQMFLRELRPADLEGSAGLYRLKEELVRRINAAVYPARVEAILFKDVLVQ